MAFDTNILALATRVGQEIKAVRTERGDLASLNTTDKTSIVAAINELEGIAASSVTQADIDAAIAALVDTAPGTLDTLNELAAALGDDPNFAATVTAQLALKANAADVYTKAEIGDPLTDYVPAFEAALL